MQTVDTRPPFFLMNGLGTRLVPRVLTCQRSLESERDHVSGKVNRTLQTLTVGCSSAVPIRRVRGQMAPGFEMV